MSRVKSLWLCLPGVYPQRLGGREGARVGAPPRFCESFGGRLRMQMKESPKEIALAAATGAFRRSLELRPGLMHVLLRD